MEITSSRSVQKASRSCPRPIVYFPLLTPSCSSNASCTPKYCFHEHSNTNDHFLWTFLSMSLLKASAPPLSRDQIAISMLHEQGKSDHLMVMNPHSLISSMTLLSQIPSPNILTTTFEDQY